MTVFQFYKTFDTEQKCCDYLVKVRWPDGIKCPHCKHEKYYLTNGVSRQGRETKKEIAYQQYKCANSKCHKKFTVTTGTIFHGCKMPLWQFFFMIFTSVINKKNISSYQQGVSLGLAQKNVWFMMSKIRMLCFQDENLKFEGEIEVDEAFLAAGKFGTWRKHATNRKIPVLGILQRGGNIVIKVIPNRFKKTVQDIILKHVECGSRLFTDSAACYFNMDSYYLHETINHRAGEYVRGDVYTNGIECAWAHLKKAINGTHHSVSILHLQRYCDEFAYRWNNRNLSPMDKFNDLLKRGCNCKPISNEKTKMDVKKRLKLKYTTEVFAAMPKIESNNKSFLKIK
ncbi:MAG: IS1595 family transposase [Bacteroidota bacterium]